MRIEREILMKKILIGISQIVVFWITYEIVAAIASLLLGLIFGFLFNLNFFQTRFFMNISETISYTFTPIIIASILSFIMRKLYRKTKLFIVPCIINFMILAWMLIDNLISVISQYGLISWSFANQIWYDVIFCFCLFVGLAELLIINPNNVDSDKLS